MHYLGCNCSIFCRGKIAEAKYTQEQAKARVMADRGRSVGFGELTLDEAMVVMRLLGAGYVDSKR